jgi:hypothetical protein
MTSAVGMLVTILDGKWVASYPTSTVSLMKVYLLPIFMVNRAAQQATPLSSPVKTLS